MKQEIRKKVGNWKMQEIRISRNSEKVENHKKVGNPKKVRNWKKGNQKNLEKSHNLSGQ